MKHILKYNNYLNENNSLFKDSKVVDDNGNLLKVYHGTYLNNGVYERLNDVTYFTDNKNTAYNYPIESYTYFDSFDSYVDYYELDMNDIKELSSLYDIDKLKSGSVMAHIDDFFSIWKDFDYSNIYVYEAYLNIKNPLVIENSYEVDITNIIDINDSRIVDAKKNGCDGIIGIYPYKWFSQDKIDYQNNKGVYSKEKHFITFNSNQIKLINSI